MSKGIKSIGDTSHRMPDSTCLSCSKVLSGTAMVNGDARPDSGDITVCIYCGHIMVFADGLTLRNPTDAEMIEIAGDERILGIQRLRALTETSAEDEHAKIIDSAHGFDDQGWR